MPKSKPVGTGDEVSPVPADPAELVRLSASLVGSYIGHNQVPMGDIPSLIANVHSALAKLAGGGSIDVGGFGGGAKPAVPIKKSVGDDYLICLEDGKKLKMLKRYLRSNYNMSPEEYRVKWGLSSDYPMVAPSYARQRSEFAKRIGLGRIPSDTGGNPRPRGGRRKKDD